MRSLLVVSIATAVTLAATPATRAEDIDLYLTTNLASNANPNVLFIVDTASSNNSNMTNTCGTLNKKIAMEKCTLINLLNSTDVGSNVNMGLATYAPGGGPSGAQIKYAIRPMDATNKASLIAAVEAIDTVNNAPYALSMHEAYLYYAGQAPRAGVAKPGYDAAAYDSGTGRYNSPITSRCQKNYIVYIGNGGPDSSESTTAESLLRGLGGVYNTDPISLTPSGQQSNWQDEYSRYLFRNDLAGFEGSQNLITYTIAVYDSASNNENTNSAKAGRALLQSTALQGGGKYFTATDADGLARVLKNILVEVQAVNSVFASVTLPVSVNVRGTYLNQVYMGVFRPDADAMPRWIGNLKEYQLQLDSATNTLYLADVNGAVATNSASGFINPTAVSYWTHASTFWSHAPNGAGTSSDSPDGDVVEKGAAAQWLRGNFASSQAGRKLYTCTGSCTVNSPLSATPFDSTNTAITQANTGTTDATDLSNLIKWTRGQDLYDENLNTVTTDVRASIHGDVLHSRPAVVNYNRHNDENDVFVFYGANDGIFHAIQGGQIQADGTPESRRGGIEQWGFIPSELFGSLKRIRDNNVNIKSPNPSKPNFADGPIGIYQKDTNGDGKLTTIDNDQVKLYIGMRRGGRFVYALDVTDPTVPKFLWKRSSSNAGFSEIGQTWSLPRPKTVRAFSNPVIIMGGGYDAPADDALPQGTATMGRAIMMIDATNGDLLWQAGPAPVGGTHTTTVASMTRAIPGDVLALDKDGSGHVDRLYAADTGGNLWRVDVDDANPANWKVTQLASLRNNADASNARKFLYAPDVVYGSAGTNSTQPYDAILIGSGDREHPTEATVVNRFYMVKDTNLGLSVSNTFTTIVESELYDTTANLIQVGTNEEKATARAALDAARGWYVTFGTGEKAVGGSVTVSGSVYFGTNKPVSAETGACHNLGEARLYTLDYLTGASTLENDGTSGLSTTDRSTTLPGGGFPPSPVPVVIMINGVPHQAVISGTQVQKTAGEPLSKRYRTYWHNRRDNP